jgi:hypothetical protein
MKPGVARAAATWGAAAMLPSAGAPLYFAAPEPWGALLWFYLFLACGALVGASLARHGAAGPVALRFGAAFSIPGAVLPFSLLPAEGLGLVGSTAAAWGLALGSGAALGALLSGRRLARARSRLGAAARAGGSLLVAGALGGAAATLLLSALPPRGYFAGWTVGLVGSLALGGALLQRTR